MLNVKDLKFGSGDAENYKKRENKMLFNQLFVKTEDLDKICNSDIYFLIGEKGTGKTAYAIYFCNNAYKEFIGDIKYIRETDYLKFIALKKDKHLNLTDYMNIWKVIIYLLISQKIKSIEGKNYIFKRVDKFKQLQSAIEEYYSKAFSPEIMNALHFIEKSELSARIMSKYFSVNGAARDSLDFTESRFQTNLFYIQKNFEEAFNSLKLKKNYILFIDGIDIRPSSVPYNEYIDCIKGLANAIWSVNNDILSRIKDSKGRLRVVSLIRPDIFESIGLQNQNTKIRDNSVLLDWRTTYVAHRKSNLFKVADRLLSYQQSENSIKMKNGESWDYYFPFDAPNVYEKFDHPTSFIAFLRLSLYRPRDIITMLDILKDLFVYNERYENDIFRFSDVADIEFLNRLSSYLLGEIKDHLTFYYTKSDYELFLKFFEFLKGRDRFDYDTFMKAYNAFEKYLKESKKEFPEFMKTGNDFLQFLYDINLLCYFEEAEDGGTFIRWCFRERNYANISPKVQTYQNYEIHSGIARALNLGKRIKK